MESQEERQQLEITALKSIYDNDFIDCPPPKVWKGAPRLPEFIIKVSHPDPEHTDKIYFHLHTKFPKTYPTIACPTFTIQQPIHGLKTNDITQLSNTIHAEAQKQKGEEMVFQIVTFAQEWITHNVKPPVEVVGSLATEMNRRAHEEELAKRQKEEEQAEQEEERNHQLALELEEQIRVDAYRQQLERERLQQVRKRAMSDATEVPTTEDLTPTESFTQEIEWQGARFSKVKLFHPRQECLGTMYQADPVCEDDDQKKTLPLELLSITFHAQYYTTTQGRKKLKQLESEIQRLTLIRHANVLTTLAVKLTSPTSSGSPRLIILTEQRPAVTLKDVLEDCDWLREDRASDYLLQILSGLQAIHARELVHRGLCINHIGLAPREEGGRRRSSKFQGAYHVAPEAFRDIHAMLMGSDVAERFPDVHTALRNCTKLRLWECCFDLPHLQQQAVDMLTQSKKHPVSSGSLLANMQGALAAIPIPGTLHRANPGPKTPMWHPFVNGSPETDYFRMPPPKAKHASRWKEDWEELELLGRGAFGSVVKARNKIDSRIYAVKKIRLRATQSDSKIFREVNALSRLNHRSIVRYYTTWVETSEPDSTAVSSESDRETATDGDTSVPDSRSRDPTLTLSPHSFPSIHFTRSGSADPEKGSESASSGESEEAFDSLFKSNGSFAANPAPTVFRTLYIQMEYVERQTLKERIAEGLSEEDAWRLFQQIVDALVHMSSLGIMLLHEIRPNLPVDGKGDCKVGDFGLATSSLAAVDPSDVTAPNVQDADMTLDVGTRLYIAPEVQSSRGGPRDHTKADIYSLGVVFFEMNYTFSTGAERIAVLEDLRKLGIFFPISWQPHRARQRRIITWLLQHNPNDRPTALELSQSSLLPPRLEDEYFKGALKMMTKPDSPHLQAVLSSLFNQPAKPVRGFLYDTQAGLLEHVTLNGKVIDCLVEIFRLHGAVNMEPPLLMPNTNPEEERNRAVFLDRHGEVVALPNNALLPFARLAAREGTKRIKRFYIGDIYRPNVVSGHPRVAKAAVFDIITPDLVVGPTAAAAEALSIVNDCLNNFANLAQLYEIHISHSRILDVALDRVPSDVRDAVMDILDQTKSSQSQKRSMLLRKGISRNVADELELLCDVDEDIDSVVSRLEKAAPALLPVLIPYIQDVKSTIAFAAASGVTRPILFNPLMTSNRNPYFKDGVCFEVVRRNKRSDILAAGGRYDNLISRLSPPKPKSEMTCAVAVQIALDKITAALAAFQSASVKTLLKEHRSFGYWSPRRCDVYVVSYQPGYLADRLEVAAMLWQHNISTDVIYDSSIADGDGENHLDVCYREGILFVVYPRPRTARRADQPWLPYKVKSVLRGTEYEVSRHELVLFLQQQLLEQKRIDASISGVPAVAESSPLASGPKEPVSRSDVQLILPSDTKKRAKYTKQMFLDRTFEAALEVKQAAASGMPTIAVDLPASVFDELSKNASWVTDEEAWKAIAVTLPAQYGAYAHQIRDAVSRKKADGQKYILLFAVKDERISLLTL
ncbi:uncharacterized protein B0H18DRAFT_1013542 [Fomitopsis serialis]|uniref:uncharacterized protein n=1 Tax=Fomitopsis serialis TaxID=139415 RepID=UPI002007B098|nr:uncharacterized protein B0H18DRAFT_1013542 [Neoantrodia serialis]KAH9923827.1 hypothetical protein B0H18DRAFT_1013542 [Neoantrodia serialis]